MKRPLTVLLCFVLCVWAPACGEEDVADTGPTAGPDSGQPPITSEFTLVVESIDTTGAILPTAALVACDMPDGRRLEDPTDSAGRLPMVVEWTPGGTLAFTIEIENMPLMSYTGYTEALLEEALDADGELHLTTFGPQGFRIGNVPYVLVSGKVHNVAPEAQGIHVSTSARGSTVYDVAFEEVEGDDSGEEAEPDADFAVMVPPDVPFQLVATAWSYEEVAGVLTQTFHGWGLAESDSVSEHTRIDIDLSDELAKNVVTGHIDFPGHADTRFFNEARFGSSVRTLVDGGPGADVGFLTYRESPRDVPTGAVDYDLEWVEPDGAELVTGYYLSRGTEHSWVYVAGPPTDGTEAIPFFEPPQATLSEDGSTLSWTVNDTDGADGSVRQVVAVLQGGCQGPAAHWVQVAPGVRSTGVPAPPSDVDPAQLYGDHPCGRVLLCGEDEALPGWCPRYASSMVQSTLRP